LLLQGILDEGDCGGEECTLEKIDVYLKSLDFIGFVAMTRGHYAEAQAGAFVADTLSDDRELDSDANDLDLISIFKYYDDDDNGSVDLVEARKALVDLFTVSKRAFQDHPAWTPEQLSDEIITDEIRS